MEGRCPVWGAAPAGTHRVEGSHQANLIYSSLSPLVQQRNPPPEVPPSLGEEPPVGGQGQALCPGLPNTALGLFWELGA